MAIINYILIARAEVGFVVDTSYIATGVVRKLALHENPKAFADYQILDMVEKEIILSNTTGEYNVDDRHRMLTEVRSRI